MRQFEAGMRAAWARYSVHEQAKPAAHLPEGTVLVFAIQSTGTLSTLVVPLCALHVPGVKTVMHRCAYGTRAVPSLVIFDAGADAF